MTTPTPTPTTDPLAVTPPVVTAVSGNADHDFAVAVTSQATKLAMAFDSPRAIAENLVDWIKLNYSDRVSTGYWITLDGTKQRDKGLLIDIGQLPWSLRLRAMIGGWSAGFGVWSPEKKWGDMKVSVGVGAVIDYNLLDRVRPVAGFAIGF